MITHLKISQVGFPPFSTGNCKQTLLPVQQNAVWRTVNGEAIASEIRPQKKFKTLIQGEDTNVPCFEGISLGAHVTIDCIQRLWMTHTVTEGEPLLLERAVVEGSVVAMDGHKRQYPVQATDEGGYHVIGAPEGTDLFIGYFPKLRAVITNLKIYNEEWGGTYKWDLEAEEV